MKNPVTFSSLFLLAVILVLSRCANDKTVELHQNDSTMVGHNGGYGNQVKWGEHLVLSMGCGNCHTPKKMGPKGPEDDLSLAYSGHPANMPLPEVDRRDVERKGLTVTQTQTQWIGPWGVSYSANISSDSTGIGAWKEENFITAIRKGKAKGIETNRDLLPPMPWPELRKLTDNEIKAIFAYLKSTTPIHNVVPQPLPPLLARK